MNTLVAIKERPILFSGPMVRALLNGTKTQTRRAIKDMDIVNGVLPDTITFTKMKGEYAYGQNVDKKDIADCFLGIGNYCPYGKPGDRLWVRETFGYNHAAAEAKDVLVYRADHDGDQLVTWPRREQVRSCQRLGYKIECSEDANYWYPSIFMPRTASRILLEIVSVRVERVNSISTNDAIAEGIDAHNDDPSCYRDYSQKEAWFGNDPLAAFFSYATLWASINGKQSWADNPWVWVVEFKVVKL